MELGAALESLGFSTIRVLCSGDDFVLGLSRDFDRRSDFSAYGRRLCLDTLPVAERGALGDQAARRALVQAGAGDALGELERWMRAGRHELVLELVHPELGIRVCHFIHSSALGLHNGWHALRAGGIRRHGTEVPERDVMRDGLNLARAMSFKCAAAELPFGGSKTTLTAPPISVDDRARLGFIAYCIDAGHLMTGPDVGLAPELIDALAELTPHILCGPRSPLGQTGGPTADGVLAALRAGAEARWGQASLRGRRVAIQGLGSVGLELALRLAHEGARVVAADTDPARVALARSRIPGLEIVDPSAILELETDVLCPSALGGLFDRERIAALRTELVYGAANNQLAAFTSDEEIELADAFAARGIPFQPDWTYTMGGVLAGYEEYQKRAAASSAKVAAEVARIAGEGSRALLREAAQSGRTPTALALERHFPRVHPDEPC
jgi:glutamate dehydrogenase/leucine dehydrogenase